LHSCSVFVALLVLLPVFCALIMPKKLVKTPTASSTSGVSLHETVPRSLRDPSLPLPRLVVFDLDYTCWPLWLDTHITPPVKPTADHVALTDRFGETYTFYDDVPSILQTLPRLRQLFGSATTSDEGTNGSSDGAVDTMKLAVASRTSAPSLARDMLKMLHLQPIASTPDGTPEGKPRKAIEVFDGGMEIYPSSKIRHFEALHKRTGIPYEDMLFFDDEARNRDTETLGVTMWLVRDGVTWDEVDRGVTEWRRRRGYGKSAE